MNERERLVELLKNAKKYATSTMAHLNIDEAIDISYDDLQADYLLENGVVVLPCRLGDKVFVVPTVENKRTEITPMECLGFSISRPCNVVCCFDDKNKLYQPSFEKFGKTVFLTREEAEQALKGGVTNE